MSAPDIPQGWFSTSQATAVSLLLVSTVFVVCCTRKLSGNTYNAQTTGRKGSNVPMQPYWLPWAGHSFQLLASPVRFLEKYSYQSSHDVFSFRIFGSVWNVIFTPSTIKSFFEQKPAVFEGISAQWFALTRAFGADRRRKQGYLEAHQDSRACISKGLPEAMKLIIAGINANIPSLLSFSDSVVDQNLWERDGYLLMNVDRQSGNQESLAVEASLFPLIRNFVGHVSVSSMMGAEFLEHYPNTLNILWDFDDGFKYMILGLPRWFPILSLPKAHIARLNLLNAFGTFHRALDQVTAGGHAEVPWRDMNDVSALMRDRSAVWQAHGLGTEVRGPCDLALIWHMNTNVNNLVFWMLISIWATPGLVDRIREEMVPFARAWQPEKLFALPELPRLETNLEGLVHSCPLLKACYYECLRLHSAPASVRSIRKDFELTPIQDNIDSYVPSTSYVLKAGTFVTVLLNVHQNDARTVESPNEFRPERFLIASGSKEGQRTADPGTLRPWGGGELICPGREFAEREVLGFTAGILALWDFEPVGRKGWKVPGHKEAAGMALPSTDIRVRIRRRQLP